MLILALRLKKIEKNKSRVCSLWLTRQMCKTLWEPLFHVTGIKHWYQLYSCTNICPSLDEMPHGHAMNYWMAGCQKTANHRNRKLALCSPEMIFPSHTWRTIFASQFRKIISTVASCIYEILVILAVEVILIFRFISMDYIMLSHFLLNLTLILWHCKTQSQSCLGKRCPVPETQTKQTVHRFKWDMLLHDFADLGINYTTGYIGGYSHCLISPLWFSCLS